ncbi:MAG TPA: TIR domain-containing protein [Terriglobales bacterium]
MRAIFVSYRRDDSEGEAGRLFDDLVAEFGEDSVFMDVAAIEVGRDFRKAIDESVATCGVLLSMIGKNWTEAKNSAGQRRLDDPSDFVRLETASALKRDIPVIPVLVHGARMPSAEELPNDLKELAYRNGVELTHARWNSDVQLLFKALRPHVGDRKSAPANPTPTVPQAPPEIKPPVRVETKLHQGAAQSSATPEKKPMGIILAVVAAVLVVGAVVGYMTLRSKKPTDVQTTAANQPTPAVQAQPGQEQKTVADKPPMQGAAPDQKALPDTGTSNKTAADTPLAQKPPAGAALATPVAVDRAASEKAVAATAAELHYGQQYHLLNGYKNWTGGFLDTNNWCTTRWPASLLCVSTSQSADRAGYKTATWTIRSASGKKTGDVVRANDLIYLHNEFTAKDGGYLDTDFAGCQGNYYCVSTAPTSDRVPGQKTGTWKVISASGIEEGGTLHVNDPVYLQNLFNNFGGGYLDTRNPGCEGNYLCVSTSKSLERDSNSTHWKFQ